MIKIEVAKKIIENGGSCYALVFDKEICCEDCPACINGSCAIEPQKDEGAKKWMQDWLDKQCEYINVKNISGDDIEKGQVVNAENIQVGGGHYKNFKIQPSKFCELNGLDHLESCIIKRACRHQDKGKLEDLKKIIHEARLIALYKYNEEI